MHSSKWTRWGALAAMLGGVAFLSEPVIFAVSPSLAEPLLPISYLLTAAGLVGLHALQSGDYGRIGQAGFYTASSGSLASILATVVPLIGGAELDLLHTIGALLVIVGYIIYGAATLQARVLPHWCGVAFIVVGPGTVALLGFGGNTLVVLGLFWLALGYALWSRRANRPRGPRP